MVIWVSFLPITMRPMGGSDFHAGLVAVTWMIGAYSILFGVLLTMLGFRLRNMSKGRLAAV